MQYDGTGNLNIPYSIIDLGDNYPKGISACACFKQEKNKAIRV